jgi:hypothetical protein
MGLAASQARLLFLTSRLSDLELRAQVISSAKIRLAEESSQASMDYTRALDKQQLRINKGDGTYLAATAANLTTYDPSNLTLCKPRLIEDAAGRILLSEKMAKAYDNATSKGNDGNVQDSEGYYWNAAKLQEGNKNDGIGPFLKQRVGYSSSDEYKEQNPDSTQAEQSKIEQKIIYWTNVFTGAEKFMEAAGYTSNTENTDPSLNYDSGAATYYANLYSQIQTNGKTTTSDDNMISSDWLESQVKGNGLFLYEQQKQSDGTNPFVSVSWTSGDYNIQEATDSTDTATAEAKYEATTADIQSKDKRFDLSLKNIDTEHQATQTTIDSVKKLIDKNIERAFKIFQA